MAIKKGTKGNPYLKQSRAQEGRKYVQAGKAETKRRKQKPSLSPDYVHALIVEDFMNHGVDIDIKRRHPLLMAIKPKKEPPT